jgi:hypothetical protein
MIADDAVIHAIVVAIPVLAGECPLRPLFLGDVKLLWGQAGLEIVRHFLTLG